jgi:ribosomal protein L32
MAVPKKRTSKSRKNIRKNQWKLKARHEAQKALATAKQILKTVSQSEQSEQTVSE